MIELDIKECYFFTMAKKAKTDPKIAYQYHPHGAERCGVCVMFRAPNSCTHVAGNIVRQGWCKIFAAKKT